ncbi:MAG: RecQ family ATP-dependent DNA helicase [Flavobacteriales bacterium]|nr:RecQ family ATP-dependent DNA helicase [Flavobacteriales bacterium]
MLPDVRSTLKQFWGFDTFRPGQEEVIEHVLAGHDTLALLPTGAGKSLCYQLPTLHQGGLCLVISPLIALMLDQVDRARSIGIKAGAVMSGMTSSSIENTLEDAAQGRLSLLFLSPERIGTELFQGRLPRMPISLIAVDEAHCISQWGYDFRPAYQRISELRPVHPEAPVLALTATATARVVEDIQRLLAFRAPNVVRTSFRRPEITFWVSHGEDKLARLLKILNRTQGSSIVYVQQRRTADQLAAHLEHHGIHCAAYHAGMDRSERDRVQAEWASGTLPCVVATNAFGMGIDRSDVRSVIHWSPPNDLESYYQEAGRAGRDGKPAFAFVLCDGADPELIRERVEAGFPSLAEVRKVFQAFSNIHRIASGSGLHESYPVHLNELAGKAGIRTGTALHALKALELNGTLVLSEGVHTPSRVQIKADHATIMRSRKNDKCMGAVLEAVRSAHGGLFEGLVIVEEERLARMSAISVQEVVDRLKELHRLDLIHYRSRDDDPQVTLLVPRPDAAALYLAPEALALRKDRALKRMRAMLSYLAPDVRCREQELLAYFSEVPKEACGQCDRCVARKRKEGGSLEQDMERIRWEMDQTGT